MLRKFINIKLIIAIYLIATTLSFAQKENYIENYFISGAKKDKYDTLAVQRSQELAKESAGLLEKEIDANVYIVGPNDVFSICILSVKPKDFDAVVSPDGNLLIPGVGIVNLKEVTLSKAYTLIQNEIKKIYKVDEIYVVLKELRKFKVTVSGAVNKPAMVSATAVDRASEIIEKAGGLKYNASYRKIRILRNESKTQLKVDLLRYYIIGTKTANPTVLGGDIIVVPPSSEDESIEISGEVALPGKFEFVEGDSLSTIFRFAHGFFNSSYLDSVELVRFRGYSSIIDRKFFNLSSWKNNFYSSQALPNDIPLEAGDRIYVRNIPDWHKVRDVYVTGEVYKPGKYAVNKEDTKVSDVIARAGGVTDEASLDGAMLRRRKEIEKLDRELERLKSIPYSEMSENERRYFQARISEQKGVMAIDFRRVMTNADAEDNIFVIDEDSIYVPQQKNFINVQGRVNNPGLVVFTPGNIYLDYILLAGGYGFRADEDESLIVKKKGEQFLAKNMNYVLEPGDNILVPPLQEISFMEVFTTGLTISAQIITITGVVMALVK